MASIAALINRKTKDIGLVSLLISAAMLAIPLVKQREKAKEESAS